MFQLSQIRKFAVPEKIKTIHLLQYIVSIRHSMLISIMPDNYVYISISITQLRK